jgi:hypothetical protein
MARQTKVELIDDISGGPANQTVTFSVDGVNYGIDLNDKNAKKLHDMLAPYVKAGRRIGRVRSTSRKGRGRGRDSDAPKIRAWAAERGIDVPARGRIPRSVVDQYRAGG